MIVVVEGPDGCGKTTFTKKLAEELGYPVIKNAFFSIGEERDERSVFAQAVSLIPFSKQFDFIHDRYLMTSMVYDLIYGEGKFYQQYIGLMLDAWIGTIYIHVPFELLVQKLNGREKETGEKELKEIKERLKEIWEMYEEVYGYLKLICPDKIFKVDGFRDAEAMLSDLHYLSMFDLKRRQR